MAERALEEKLPTTRGGAPGAAFLTRRRVLTGWLALVAVYVLWGTTYNAIALGDETIPPLFLIGARFAIGGLILFPIAGRGVMPWRLPRRQWVSTVTTGLLMLAGGTGLVALAETRIPAGVAALLVATVPIWTLLIDAVWNRHRVSPLAIVAIVLGLIGVFVLVHPSGSEHVNLVGAGAVLLGAIFWAAGSVQSKSANQPRNPFLASAMQMLGASVFLLLAGLATGELDQLHPAQIGWSGVLALAWLVVGGSLVAYSSYLIALRLLPLATVSTYAFVNPLIAVVLGGLFFNEALNLQVGIAALFTVAAIVVLLVARGGRTAAGH